MLRVLWMLFLLLLLVVDSPPAYGGAEYGSWVYGGSQSTLGPTAGPRGIF